MRKLAGGGLENAGHGGVGDVGLVDLEKVDVCIDPSLEGGVECVDGVGRIAHLGGPFGGRGGELEPGDDVAVVRAHQVIALVGVASGGESTGLQREPVAMLEALVDDALAGGVARGGVVVAVVVQSQPG